MGKDWRELGDSLEDIIETAIRKGNFGHLNDKISGMVDASIGKLRKAAGWDAGTGGNMDRQGKSSRDSELYFANRQVRLRGCVRKFVSGLLLVPFGLILLFVMTAIFEIRDGSGLEFLPPVAVLIASAFAFVNGAEQLKLSGRFKHYVQALGDKDFMDVKDLARLTGRSHQVALKEVKRMLAKGWFLQGHLDSTENCLMVSDQAYQQYLATVKGIRQQEEERFRRESAAQEQKERRRSSLSAEAQAVIEEGRQYIKRIRESNDRIPGVEVSEKMDRMEQLVEKIFQQVELHPENIGDLRRLMEYYLPMAIKLLDAYEELDRQPVRGQNITSSKEEIMKVLDTLNIAFEKLLDNLFQDATLDLSADISVLQTTLAQDGLTKDDFPKR